MRLCTYIIKRDKGLAPNPFWGYCTLALCTPNHMGIKLSAGDWIAGFTEKASGNKLVYCMQVDEVLDLDEYFHDNRFEKKKPKLDGTQRQRVGDNMYWLDDRGEWKRNPEAGSHVKKEHFIKDTRHAIVYIGKKFYYLGRETAIVPGEFNVLPPARQGVKLKHDQRTVREFLIWVENTFEQGVAALPAMFEDEGDCSPDLKQARPDRDCH